MRSVLVHGRPAQARGRACAKAIRCNALVTLPFAMRTICCFIISVIAGFFSFTHLSDPAGAIEQMVGSASADPLVLHASRAAAGGVPTVLSTVMLVLQNLLPPTVIIGARSRA